jgi:RNA polymerase sigma-70 factor, ECF subfamily
MAEVIDPTLAPHYSEQEEAVLVAHVKSGDQVACAKLIALFGPKMMAVARGFMRCEDDCNDALQDAFISAFKSLDRFEGNSRLSTWLHRITVNSCLLKLRRGLVRREISIEEMLLSADRPTRRTCRLPAMDDSSVEVEGEEMYAIVRRTIDRLPDGDRRVLVLRDIEEMDTTTTASILGMTEHNVKRLLHRARQTLRSLLEPMMEGRNPSRPVSALQRGHRPRAGSGSL